MTPAREAPGSLVRATFADPDYGPAPESDDFANEWLHGGQRDFGHFIGKLRARTRSGVTEISQDALSRLKEYDWPGNVRELENVIERALVLADGEKLEEGDLPLLANGAGAGVSVVSLGEEGVDLGRAVEGMEERLIRQALARTGGAKAEAARLLSIPKSRLYYKIEKYGID